jgi:hypothetical protein
VGRMPLRTRGREEMMMFSVIAIKCKGK